jgi:hypothetical protein
MDADDLAAPDRLKQQIEMFAEPDVVLVGSTAETIDGQGRRVREADLARLLRRTGFAPFAHTTTMFRRAAFDRVGGYREEAARWEDVDFFRRLAEIGRVLVIAEPLASSRQSEISTRLAVSSIELERAMDEMYRSVAGAGGKSSGGLRPEAFLPGAMIRVWNGRRPRIFRRLLQLGDLGWNRSTVRMMVWAAWANLSPRSLRLVMRLLLGLRNRRARRLIAGAQVLEWKPPR